MVEGRMAGDWNLADVNAADLFQMAVAIEQGGFDFYEGLRSGQTDPRLKKEFEFLRDEEAKHKELFLSFLHATSTTRSNPPTRLQALVQREFIDPLSKMLQSSRIETNYETITFGQELEKKSIAFYKALLLSVEPPRRADVERILAEEQRHLEQLQLLRAHH
jgi:rubrerythrin